MIIGTAGHIDHGKSALVSALTGRPTDRLAEERRRGITIDLNFAPLELGPGTVAGVVDVPGHEDFVRTMVAGASGVDLALLVIAADEGIMPQTEEHLAVLEYLGVPAAIPVITKADLVDPEWLELVLLEVADRVARSPVGFGAPAVVSARSGQGIGELRQRIASHGQGERSPAAGDLFRLPIDRAFSLPGVGTVVTGTARSGRLKVGEPVVVLPRGSRGRVRSIESYGHELDQTSPAARTAVGIAGLDRATFRRGDSLVQEGTPWAAVMALDVELALHPRAPRALAARSRVRVHLGTSEIMARVVPREPIAPGERGLARLSLEAPAVARAGDRFVIRSFSPVTTIGGGRVLDPAPPRRRALWHPGLAAGAAAERLQALLARRPAGIAAASLPVLLGLPPAEALRVARDEPSAREVGGAHFVAVAEIERASARALALVHAYHRANISDPGMPLETLRHSLGVPEWLAQAAIGELLRERRLASAGGIAALAGFRPRAAGGDAEIEQVVRLLCEAGLSPPTVGELERQTGRSGLAGALRVAGSRGLVEAVERDRWYARQALDRFTEVLTELGGRGPILPAAVRDRLGISRKYLIPLLEWADGRGITVRTGDARRLRQT